MQTLSSSEQWSHCQRSVILILSYPLDSLLLSSQTCSSLFTHSLCCFLPLPSDLILWSQVNLTKFLKLVVVLLVPPMSLHGPFLFHKLCQPPSHRLLTGCQTITESQNHRIVRVGRDLCGSSSPPPLPKQGHLQ